MKKYIINTLSILSLKERRRFKTLLVLNALVSIADIGSIALLFVVLNIYSGHPAAVIAPAIQQLGLQAPSLIPGLLLIIVFTAKSITGYQVSRMQYRYGFNVASRLSGRNLLRYLEGSYADHVNIDSAIWVRRICYQPTEFAQYVLSGVQLVINESILILISVTALALYNIRVLAIVSLVLLPAILILAYITKKRMQETRRNIQVANERSLQHLNEALAGFVESNLYDKNAFFINRYAQSQFTLNRFVADMQVTQAIPSRFFETFAVLGLFILIAAVKLSGAHSDAGILMLGAFVAAAYKIIPGISRIINAGGQAKTYLFTVKELADVENTLPNNTPYPAVQELQKIELRNIHFSYGNKAVLNGFNCTLNKSSLIGISGNSGKGKTSLINLLLGFITPGCGQILFNEKPLNEAERRNYWPQIAYVKQEPFILHDTLLHNITLFKPAPGKQHLQQVIQAAGLTEWISQLPGGLQTTITENGKNISGGQRQRIAIARALFKDAPVIILDEPFNELDEASEICLLHYFKQLAVNGKIILLITHNSNSLDFCDNVIYLNEQA